MLAKIAFIFAAALPAAINASIVLKKKNSSGIDKLDPNVCYYKLYTKFSLSKEIANDYSPEPADEETKNLCPTLDVSCCKTEALKGQFDVFKNTYLQLREYFFVHSNITHSLRKHGIKPLNTKGFSHKCSDRGSVIMDGEDKPADETPETMLSHFLFEMDQTLANSKSLNYTLSKYYSGFICGYCHPSVIKYFSEKSSIKEDAREELFFRYGMESYKAYMAMVVELVQYWVGINRAYFVFKRLPKVEGFFTDIDFIAPEQLACALEKIKDCLQVTSVSALLKNPDHCFIGLEIGLDMGIKAHRFDRIIAFYRDVNEYFFLKFNDLKMFPKNSEKLAVNLDFSIPNINTDHTWSSIGFDLVEDGFSMTKHQYNEKLWFLSAVRLGITALVGMAAQLMW